MKHYILTIDPLNEEDKQSEKIVINEYQYDKLKSIIKEEKTEEYEFFDQGGMVI